MTKTLAEYTPGERQKMIGMWCDCTDIYAPCVLADIDGRDAVLIAADLNGRPVLDPYDIRHVVPRFDLPRAWNPDGTPAAVAEVVRLRKAIEDLLGTLSKAKIDIARGDYEYGQHTAFLMASSRLTRILEGETP